MDFEPGDVVFVPFPYRDRLAEAVRPAVVVSRREFNVRGDLVIAAITSHSSRDQFDIDIKDWQQAKLVKPSTVRMLVATMADVRVQHKAGRLSDRDWKQVQAALEKAIEIGDSK